MTSPKRKYVRLSPAVWAEICALWEVGDVTLAELAERYGVSQRALQSHFAKHKVLKGEKTAQLAAVVKEAVYAQELDDKDLLTNRARAIRESAYENALMVERLIMGQLELAQKDPTAGLRVSSGLKALALAAAGLERLHDLKRRALGLDKETFVEEELPQLIFQDLTEAEIKAAQERDDELENGEEADADSPASDRDHRLPVEDGAEDDVVFEGSEPGPSPPEKVRLDAEGCRLVREAQC